MSLPMMMEIMVCQTLRPEETREEPCCQFEMQIWFIALVGGMLDRYQRLTSSCAASWMAVFEGLGQDGVRHVFFLSLEESVGLWDCLPE